MFLSFILHLSLHSSEVITMESGLHPWTSSRPHRSIHFVCLPSIWLTNLCRCRKWRITVSRTTARTTVENKYCATTFCVQLWIHSWGRLSICWCIYCQIAVKRGFVLNVRITSGIAKTICLPRRGQICSLSCTPWTGDRISELKPHSEDLHCDRHWLSGFFYHGHWSEDIQTIRNQEELFIRHIENMMQSIREVTWAEYFGKRKVYSDLELNRILISALVSNNSE